MGIWWETHEWTTHWESGTVLCWLKLLQFPTHILIFEITWIKRQKKSKTKGILPGISNSHKPAWIATAKEAVISLECLGIPGGGNISKWLCHLKDVQCRTASWGACAIYLPSNFNSSNTVLHKKIFPLFPICLSVWIFKSGSKNILAQTTAPQSFFRVLKNKPDFQKCQVWHSSCLNSDAAVPGYGA